MKWFVVVVVLVLYVDADGVFPKLFMVCTHYE